MFAVFSATWAQQRKINGRVTDSKGDPVPATAVQIVGTTEGATADAEGYYDLTAKTGDRLEFTSIGYVEQTITLGNQNTLNVVLKSNSNVLGETVVTALGIERKEHTLGYAISTIGGSELVKAGVTLNPFEALYGKAAGVGISIGSAGPEGGVNIKIRGAASLEATGNTRPLFVVDGVIIHDQSSDMTNRGYDPLNSFDYGSGINDLNPEDIKSITILKSAKAAILYGSEGANGVVLITTKDGAGTRGLGVQFHHGESWEVPVNYIDFQNEYGSGVNQYDVLYAHLPNGDSVRKTNPSRFNFGPKFDGKPSMFFDSTMIPYQAYPNNFLSLFRTGRTENTSVAIAGASEKGNMRAAFTNESFQDILENAWQRKNSFSFNGKMNASKFATFEVNAQLYHINTHNRRPNIGGMVAWGINRDYPYNRIKSMYLDSLGYQTNLKGAGLPTGVNQLISYFWQQDNNSNLDDKIHLISSARATLHFTPSIFLLLQAGLDYTDINYTREDNVTQINPTIGGQYRFERQNFSLQNYQALLNYNHNFIGDKLNIFAFGGAAYQKNADNDMYVSTYGDLSFPNWYSLNNAPQWPGPGDRGKVLGSTRGADIMYSVLGDVTASWDNEFYLDISARNDWSSTLDPSNNSYFYPGVGLNWIFTNKIHIPQLQFGKVRASWADVGRAAPSRYYTLQNLSVTTLTGTNALDVTAPSSLFAGIIKPEKKRSYEVGFETDFFHENRASIDFSFYTNNIYNNIMAVPVSSTTGAGDIIINAGNVKNWGYELLLKGTPLLTKSVRWDLTFTAADQKSKVIDLYPGITSKTISGGPGLAVVAQVGKPAGEIQMNPYMTDPEGQRVVTAQGIYQLDNSKFVNVGSTVPSVFGGFLSDFYLKGFDFHIGIDYNFGASVFSYSNYYLTGMGITKNTLKYRDTEHGGLSYYIDKATGANVAIAAGAQAPPQSADGKVYHDGLILPGVQAVTDNSGKTTYVSNTTIISAYTYYSTYIHDLSTGFQPDNVFKNNYIKLRELAVSYAIPQRISRALRMQKVSFTAAVQNLFYFYKTLPNVDAESTLGTDSYIEDSFYPAIRTFTLGIDASF
jgi:iron complex outermembrane receptor protein